MISYCGPGTFFRGVLLFLGLLVSFSNDPGVASAQAADPKKKDDKTDIAPAPKDANYLSMEVNALRTLYLLRGTDPGRQVAIQLPLGRLLFIKEKFASCAQKEEKKREKADISDAYRKVLVELRAALIAGQDERIEELDKQLQELQKVEDPDLDDQVEITDEARKKAENLVKTCSADQVVAYLASYGKDFPHLQNTLFAAMRVTIDPEKATYEKKPSPEEWKKIRAFTIREVAWQVGGLDSDKQKQIGVQIAKVLDKTYAMSEGDLKKNVAELRQGNRANHWGKTSAFDLMKNVMDQDIAEMLSNPRLIPAVEARLKYLEATEKAKKKPRALRVLGLSPRR